MQILVAPQELKGTLTAREAMRAICEGVRAAGFGDDGLEAVPLADGGPGTLDALVSAQRGEVREVHVCDPLGRSVCARFGLLPDGTAVIEMAEAAGLWRILPEERTEPNAARATTHGVGGLIRAALDAGARRVLVGAGGSATTDGGRGALEALGARIADRDDGQGCGLSVDLSGLDPRLVGEDAVPVEVLSDVENPLLGPLGAVPVFGPQKGLVSARAREDAQARLARWSRALEQASGRRGAALQAGAGAAGGLAFGLCCALGSRVRPGFEAVADASSLRERIGRCEVVLTAEGRLDAQTAMGKGPAALARLAAEEGVPCILFTGSVADDAERTPFAEIVIVGDGPRPSPAQARVALVEAARRWRMRLAQK